MKVRMILALFIITIVAGLSSAAFAGDAAIGKSIYENKKAGNCKMCHKTTKKKLVGPGLEGVSARHSDGWMKKWLKDPQATWEENDAETHELKKQMKKEKRKKTAMKLKRKLSDEEIDNLVAYLKTL